MVNKSSGIGRTFELLKMAGKVGFKKFSSGSNQSKIEQARAVVETLSILKGAAMKAGQLLSLELSDYFPPEALEILAKLQNNVPAHSYDEIEKILKKELGVEKFQRLYSLSKFPAASASIGQVHSAYIGEKPVALKIQYPGVRESVDSDLKLLRKAADTFCFFSGRKVDLDPLFKELHSVLSEEVNYKLEAAKLESYRKNLKADYRGPVPMEAPEHIPEFSTERILAMSWAEGISLREWCKKPQSRESRTKIAESFLELYCVEFFKWGLVQTDPNHSNFLVQDLPELKIVLLDFGATREYTKEVRREYVNLLKAMATQKPEKIIAEGIRFGLIDARESENSKNLFSNLLILGIKPFIDSQKGQKFRFADDRYLSESNRVTSEFVKSLAYTSPPHKILFLHRKLGGVFSILRKLDVELDVAPYWEKMLRS